jgi:hypothetical protein
LTPRARTRTRGGQPVTQDDPEQVEVENSAAELALLWRSLSGALARDSAGGASNTGERHQKPTSRVPSAPINIVVSDAIAAVEPGLYHLLALARQELRIDATRVRTPPQVIAQLPVWHRAFASHRFGRRIRRDTKSYLGTLRRAIGVQRSDEPMGMNCPDHRDTNPTELREEGALAALPASLLAGPPARTMSLAGPVCVARARITALDGCGLDPARCQQLHPNHVHDITRRGGGTCRHESCELISERRVWPGDWIVGPDGDVVWASLDGTPAFTWKRSGAVICPSCRQAWTTTAERRILAARLRALGDSRPEFLDRLITGGA